MNNIIDLKKYMSSSIKNQQFWIELMDVFSNELYLLSEEKINVLLKNIYDYRKFKIDPDTLNDESEIFREQFLAIPDTFGYPIDLSIRDDLSFVRSEIESISFRKNFKTTTIGYEYSYKNIEKDGQVFLIYWTDAEQKLVRAESSQNIRNFEDTVVTDFTVPYLYLSEKEIEEYFLGEIEYDQLDSVGNELEYDQENIFYDISALKKATKHIAIEYFLNEIFTEEGKDYLIQNNYLDFLKSRALYNRRVVQVPHVGSQLSIILDPSGITDNSFPEDPLDPVYIGYTMPDIKLSGVVTENFEAGNPFAINRIKIGTGSQPLPSREFPGTLMPTDLEEPLYSERITFDEIIAENQWTIIQSMIGIEYKEDLVDDVPLTNFSGTLSTLPIQRKSIQLHYRIGGIDYIASDDGEGNLNGPRLTSGSINYITGEYIGEFAAATDSGTQTLIGYSYNSIYKETEEDFSLTEITEVGLFDDEGDMVAYATFPPIQYNDNNYHISFQFIIAQFSFEIIIVQGGNSLSEFDDVLFGGDSMDEFVDVYQGI